MGIPKQPLTYIFVLAVASLWADFAEAAFLTSTHGHILSHDNMTRVVRPDYNKGQSRNTGHQHVEKNSEEENHESPKENDRGEGEIVQAGHKYPGIYFAHKRLERVFGKQFDEWWKDWKLWFGLLSWLSVWAKWLAHGYDEIYWQRAVYAFGINIIILHHLQYATTILVGMIGVCGFLAAQCIFQNLVWFHLGEGEEDNDDDDFLADTLYLDLSLPAEQGAVLFVAQVCVWWFYMTSILGNFDFGHVNYAFWLVAFMSMQMTMIFNRGKDSVLGNSFPVHDVWELIEKCDNTLFKIKDSDDKLFRVSKAAVVMRGATGFFCNAILREIMSYTIPLMLMGFSEPMDFVVYCIGVNFICTIDDMSDKTFSMHSKVDEEAKPQES